MPVLRCPDHEVRLVGRRPAPHLRHPAALPGVAARHPRPVRGAATRPSGTRRSTGSTSPSTGQGGRQVVLQAQPAAQAGSTGAVTIRAKGGAESLHAPGPRDQPAAATPRCGRRAIEGLIAGTRARRSTWRSTSTARSDRPQCAITTATVASGLGRVGTQQPAASSPSRRPSSARGDARVSVSVTDAPGRLARPRRGDRHRAEQARPDRGPVGRRRPGARQQRPGRLPAAGLRRRPADPRVRGRRSIGPGGGADPALPGVPCTIDGLTNGKDYTFTVRSRNAVGWSDPQPAEQHGRAPTPSPRPPRSATSLPGDRKLTVNWTPPANKGSAVLEYRVQWTNIGSGAGGGGIQTRPGPDADEGRLRPRQQRRLHGACAGAERGGLGPLRARGQGTVLRQAGCGRRTDAQPARARAGRAERPGGHLVAGDRPQRSADHEVRRLPARRRWGVDPHRLGLRQRHPRHQRHRALPGPDGRVRRDRHERRPGHERPGQLLLLQSPTAYRRRRPAGRVDAEPGLQGHRQLHAR